MNGKGKTLAQQRGALQAEGIGNGNAERGEQLYHAFEGDGAPGAHTAAVGGIGPKALTVFIEENTASAAQAKELLQKFEE